MKSGIVSNADTTSQPLVDAELADIAARTRKLESAAIADKSVGALSVEVDSIVGYQAAKHGLISPVIRYLISGDVRTIKTVIVQRDEIVDQATYESLRDRTKSSDITDAHRAAGSVDLPFGGLEPQKTYDIIRVVGYDSSGGFIENPIFEPDFAGYPANALLSFTTPASANAPSKPTLARIVNNFVDPNSDGSLSIVVLRIFADETEVLTFAAQNTASVQPKLVDDDGIKAPSPTADIEVTSDTFIDVSVGGLVTGRNYNWTKNTAFDSEGTPAVALATSTVKFVAGGFADPADGLADLTLVSATAEQTEDPALLLVTFVLHQPNPAYKLKNYTAKRKVAANPDSDYDLPKNLVVQRGDLHDPAYSTPGNVAITFPMNVRVTRTYRVKITVRSIQGFTKDFTSGDIAAATSAPTAAKNQPIGPNMINGGGMLNSVDQYNTLYGGASVAADQDRLGLNWQTFSNSGTRIDRLGGGTLVSAGIQWLDTRGFLKLATGMQGLGGKPAVKLRKQILPGETYTFSCLLAADSAVNNVKITIALYDQASGDIVALTTAVNWLFSVLPSWKVLVAILQVPGAYVMAGRQWCEMRFTANTTDVCYTSKWKLERGENASIWVPHAEETLLDSSANIGTPSGSGTIGQQGGGILSADGVELSIASGNKVGALVY